MYKTVRHGENSLQYTILPQQDDGSTVSVRPSGRRHKKKGKTAAVVAITIVLIGGVIGTAVLVPLLLTSDLVALPAAFQKYSVATMRRTHTGNRMEIVAKKPTGWGGYHHVTTTVAPSTASTTKEPTTTTTTLASTTLTTSTTTLKPTTEKEMTTTEYDDTTATIRPPTLPPTTNINEVSPTPQVVAPTNFHKIENDWTQPVNEKDSNTDIHKGMIVFLDAGAPSVQPWHIRWTMYMKREKLVIPIVGGTIVALIIIIVLLRRRSKRRRSLVENLHSNNNPADKENLLTEPTGVSDEEQ